MGTHLKSLLTLMRIGEIVAQKNERAGTRNGRKMQQIHC
jgi:hypothetical protein